MIHPRSEAPPADVPGPAPLRERERLSHGPGGEHRGQTGVELPPVRSQGLPGQHRRPYRQGQLHRGADEHELIAQGGVAQGKRVGQDDQVGLGIREEHEGGARAQAEAGRRPLVAAVGPQQQGGGPKLRSATA